jgi:hypothetical protein
VSERKSKWFNTGWAVLKQLGKECVREAGGWEKGVGRESH